MSLESTPRWNKAAMFTFFLLRRFPVLPMAFLAGSSAAGAQEFVDHAAEYDACLRLAEVRPDDAFESALAWRDRGGGDAARHCVALALVELGHYGEAALRLQRLADNLGSDSAHLRLDILGQAGQAWMLEGELARAEAIQSAALRLAPDNVDLLLDRGITRAESADYWAAIEDLSRAVNLVPGRADILIFRASAYRYVDALELALEDVTRALAFEPENPEGLLERGILRRLAGDEIGARVDWLQVIELAAGTTAGGAAKANLELLDVKTE